VTPRRDIERNSSTLTTHAAERERERERGGEGEREEGTERNPSDISWNIHPFRSAKLVISNFVITALNYYINTIFKY